MPMLGKDLVTQLNIKISIFVFYMLDLYIYFKTFGVYRYYNKNN